MTSIAACLLIGGTVLAAEKAEVKATAAAPAIQWHDDYWTAKRECLKEKKPMLIVFDNGGDKAVRQVSHRASQREQRLLKDYVPVHIDVSTEKGRKIAGFFHASSFPCTAVTCDRVRRIRYKKTGQFTQASWENLLVRYSSTAVLTTYRAPSYNYCST